MKFPYGLAVGAVVLAAGGYGAWHFTHQEKPPAPPPPPIPVGAAQAKQADVPIYLRGVGTVRALNAVEVRPQVTGVLLAVPVREGDEVKKGDVLAVIDPRPFQASLDKAQAQRKQDQAQLDNAQTDLKRYSTLARSDFASKQQVDTQSSNVERLHGVVAADDSEIEQAQINLGYAVLHAPFDGRIGLRRVDAGNLVQANGSGQGIFSVVQDRPISVLFTLPEGELPRVRAAMARGPVPVLADSSDQHTQLGQGVLLTPDNEVNVSSGTIGMKATFDNGDGRLTPGQFVSVRLQVGIAHGVTVPHEAVQHAQDGLFVFAIKPDNTAELRKVELAYDDGSLSVISKGLDDGTNVVVSGQARVGQGTRVTAQQGGGPSPSEQSARK